ncbi:hypothetical protein [Paenibacillus sp. MMS20-IR301]|uniref:hypothetical protein n=1 Tax=Paenibacillus sp. MMS20-IR301 TaxID=2895946 RepID=UPI0028E54EDF|nr:hypothetical protein [Paenibacillus sp. MMS20-IR301]WNS41962.1 hypothetical protein LOS79_23545 [Paenibacillus sp. MMS20-IR301]
MDYSAAEPGTTPSSLSRHLTGRNRSSRIRNPVFQPDSLIYDKINTHNLEDHVNISP